MVNEKQMKSEWSEKKLISNEKWMDFIFIREVQGSKNKSTSNFQPSAIMSRVDVTFTFCIE